MQHPVYPVHPVLSLLVKDFDREPAARLQASVSRSLILNQQTKKNPILAERLLKTAGSNPHGIFRNHGKLINEFFIKGSKETPYHFDLNMRALIC